MALTRRQDLELSRLRGEFLAGLPDRVRAIEEALERVLETPTADPERVDVLFHLAHRLCGSSGIYGHAALPAAACALEGAVSALRGAPGESASRQAAALVPLVEALRRASEDERR